MRLQPTSMTFGHYSRQLDAAAQALGFQPLAQVSGKKTLDIIIPLVKDPNARLALELLREAGSRQVMATTDFITQQGGNVQGAHLNVLSSADTAYWAMRGVKP